MACCESCLSQRHCQLLPAATGTRLRFNCGQLSARPGSMSQRPWSALVAQASQHPYWRLPCIRWILRGCPLCMMDRGQNGPANPILQGASLCASNMGSGHAAECLFMLTSQTQLMEQLAADERCYPGMGQEWEGTPMLEHGHEFQTGNCELSLSSTHEIRLACCLDRHAESAGNQQLCLAPGLPG